MTEPDDLGLRLPISGVQLIEASAGTGKTFTLATLYARLVIECGLPVSAILAVTFTEAATKELRGRLRGRLVVAQRLAEALAAGEDSEAVAGESEEVRLTRALVDAAALREGARALCLRLRVACAQMDLAPIHTIHGFCRRALTDHALEAGQPLRERELIENEAGLRHEVALEFWRLHSRTAQGAALLNALWASPEALAASLRELLSVDVLRPAPEPPDESTGQALQAARECLAAQFLAHGDSARELLRQALASGSVNASVVKEVTVDLVWRALRLWVAGTRQLDPETDKLGAFASDRLQAKTNKKGVTPASPLFDAIQAWQACAQAQQQAQRGQCVALVHAARDFARQRLAALKHERALQGYDDMIGGVAAALQGEGAVRFAQRLRAQYRVALLDEFQDTDARQWTIFSRLFAGADHHDDENDHDEGGAAPRALFLIGDPKQAIYRFRGGDVFTYLAAARSADARHRLERNFRSRPSALAAVQALFELSGPDAFAQDGIGFEPVLPGPGTDDSHWRRNGEVAPALTLQLLAPEDSEPIEQSRDRATQACVAAIHGLLADGLAGRARLVDGSGVERAVEPGDIAVLVEKNDDARRIHDALARAGIPSVAAGRSSLYLSEEAWHLQCLLEALLAPADEQRLRAALATPLFGLDARQILGLEADDAQHRLWQSRMQHWHLRAQRHGPGVVLGELCAEHAPRLLGLLDGERRLTNYLQLAEELQDADVHALGLAGLLAELARRIDAADPGNDAELLRLESDARRVLIMTLHKSKGLEFAFVFLPYLATNGGGGQSSSLKMARFHDGERRVAQLFAESDDPACASEAAEHRAEKLRLLYVGLTRARLATWAVWGAVNNAQRTALAWLLHRAPGSTRVDKPDGESVAGRARALQAAAPGAVAVEAAAGGDPLPSLAWPREGEPPVAALARRKLDRDWWVHSFSQLTREHAGSEASADDEPEPLPDLPASRLSGPRFGNCLHEALEKIHFPAWLDWSAAQPPAGQQDVLAAALRAHGYSSGEDFAEGLLLLTRLIARTLNTPMPEGTRLAALPASERRNEMEFHLTLAPIAVPALLDVLHRHGVVGERQAFGLRRRLEGLLTGRIDLVYQAGERFHVLDYKSNQLRGYDQAALAAAIEHSEYDLQYVLYTLALHRWLRFRLGAGYAIERHLGGVRYVFCRGLDASDASAPGVHARDLPVSLILELDALMQGKPA